MKPTVNSIERTLDRAYLELTGVELAELVNSQLRDLPLAARRGEDVAKLKEELYHMARNYIRILPPDEKDEYRANRYEHDVRQLLELHAKDIFNNLCRQEFLINLLTIQLDLRWIHEVEECPSEDQKTPGWIDNRKMLGDLIKAVRAYKKMTTAEMEETINLPFWEEWNMTPPELPQDPLGDYETFLEKMEEMGKENV